MTTQIKKENEVNFLLKNTWNDFIENLKAFLSKKLNMFSFSLVIIM